jgi:hypothetical protein
MQILQRFLIVRLVGMRRMGEVLSGRLFLKDFLGFARRFHGIMASTPHVEVPLSRSRKVLLGRSCLSRPGMRSCLLAGGCVVPGLFGVILMYRLIEQAWRNEEVIPRTRVPISDDP